MLIYSRVSRTADREYLRDTTAEVGGRRVTDGIFVEQQCEIGIQAFDTIEEISARLQALIAEIDNCGGPHDAGHAVKLYEGIKRILKDMEEGQ